MSESSPCFTVEDIARRIGGEVRGCASLEITGPNSVSDAGPRELTFATSPVWVENFVAGRGGALLVRAEHAREMEDSRRAMIIVTDPEFAMALVLEMFQPELDRPDVGVHPMAAVDASATLGRDTRIGPFVRIGRNCAIGDRTVIHAGACLYAGTAVGPDCVVHANCVIRERSVLGARVILHQNVSVGADGFGYRPSPDRRGLIKIVHVGNVIIEDDVEIGAGTCIDRGKFGPTRIGMGTKIDNLCQIAHNCTIGRGCVIAGLTGLAGSVVVGDGCRIGGNVGIAEQLKIGRGASIAAKSGVMRDIPDGENHAGLPAEEARQALRQVAAIRKLPDLIRRLSHLVDDPQGRAARSGDPK